MIFLSLRCALCSSLPVQQRAAVSFAERLPQVSAGLAAFAELLRVRFHLEHHQRHAQAVIRFAPAPAPLELP